MELDTDRGRDADAYWRRRAVALGGVLATVGVLAWACSGSGTAQKHAISNAAAIGAATPRPQPPVARVPVSSRAPVVPTVTVTATAKVTVIPTAPRKPGDVCDPGDVVVNLAPSKSDYGRKENPHFQVSVVNTGARPCTLGVGPRELKVRIVSGSDQVWSSADCVAGTGSSIQLLKRGIPYGGSFDWDRSRSSAADCAGHQESAHPGTYVIQAKEGAIKTQRQVFHLK
jgi:hypothetical protein